MRGIDFEAFFVALLFVCIGADEEGVLVEPVILAASFTQDRVV